MGTFLSSILAVKFFTIYSSKSSLLSDFNFTLSTAF